MNGHVRARWEDALDLQVHLHDQIRSRRLLVGFNDEGRFTTMADLERRRYGEMDTEETPSTDFANTGASILVDVLDFIGQVEPVYVSHDVFDLWRHAAPDFKPEPIAQSDPFTPGALVLLPETITVVNDVPIRALLWVNLELREEHQMIVLGFTRLADIHEKAPGHLWMLSKPWTLDFDETPDERLRRAREHDERATDPEDPLFKVGLAANQITEHDLIMDGWREMQSFWRLAAALVPAREQADRGAVRRAKRADLDHYTITVIRLRRQTHSGDGDRDVDWTCRWIVRGHWRRLEGGRQVYVRPHVKGPEGLPLRVTDRAWDFSR